MNTQSIQTQAAASNHRLHCVPEACAAANAHFKANRIAFERADKFEENKRRLATANSLIRELHVLGIRVLLIDIATPRPRLYLRHAPLPYLPLAGIIRRRVDSDVFECSAILDDCELVWTEFEDEVAA